MARRARPRDKDAQLISNKYVMSQIAKALTHLHHRYYKLIYSSLSMNACMLWTARGKGPRRAWTWRVWVGGNNRGLKSGSTVLTRSNSNVVPSFITV